MWRIRHNLNQDSLFQNMFTLHIFQYGHLLDGYLVEFLETFALLHTFMDKDGIFYCIEFDAFKSTFCLSVVLRYRRSFFLYSFFSFPRVLGSTDRKRDVYSILSRYVYSPSNSAVADRRIVSGKVNGEC